MNAASPTLVSARRVSRRYGQQLAVDAVSFELSRGQVVGLLGPNGAGKTSLLKMMSGCLALSAGQILIEGSDITEVPSQARRALGFLPERCPLYEELTVAEYLDFFATIRGVSRPGPAREAALASCGLVDCRDRLIRNLSHGYRQRVGLAQAIVHTPRVLLLDEPTAGLDPIQIKEIRGLLRRLASTCCVVLSTHILAEAQTLCDRVLIIHQGQLCLDSEIAEMASGHSFRIRLRHAPPPSFLELEGITAVEALADGSFRLRHRPGTAAQERLACHAVARQWGLLELIPERNSLEETFLRLTRRGVET